MGTGSTLSRYNPRKFVEIEHVQSKDVYNSRVEKPAIFGYGQLKSENTDKYTIKSLHDT